MFHKWMVYDFYYDPTTRITGMTQDNNGNIYFIDGNTKCLFKIRKLPGTVQKIAQLPPLHPYLRSHLIWDNNILYFCVETAICLFDLEFGSLSFLDENEENQWIQKYVTGLCVHNNELYITQRKYIHKYNLITRTFTSIGDGKQYMQRDGIVKRDFASGPLMCFASTPVFRDKALYFVDQSCIRQLKNNYVTTVAGESQTRQDEGKLSQIELIGAYCMTANDKGKLFISNSSLSILIIDLNQQIRKHYLLELIKLEQMHHHLCEDHGALYLATTDEILVIKDMWRWERLLWIASMKEDVATCPIASLPRDLVIAISRMLSARFPYRGVMKEILNPTVESLNLRRIE